MQSEWSWQCCQTHSVAFRIVYIDLKKTRLQFCLYVPAEPKCNKAAATLSAGVYRCDDSPKQGHKWHQQSAGNLVFFFFPPPQFIANSFLIKPDKRRELNLKRCGDKRRGADCLSCSRFTPTLLLVWFWVFFFKFSVFARIFRHECQRPDTQEKEKERSSPCSARPINSMKASWHAIDLRDQCANPLVLPALEETRQRKRKVEAELPGR